MKKLIAVLLALVSLTAVFTGCSGKQNKTENKEKTTESTTAAKLDVDLTSLSSTVVYSEVYNMMTVPDDYRGKKVKMKGAFSYSKDNETGKIYYACVIADATACCQQGLEFKLAEKKNFEDYPEVGTEIEVTGYFDTYNEGELVYCFLDDAEMSEV
ncbi:MAG: hypothetical protein E7571_03290 [Ruminococcaceae bacterium]|jgi:hypothetical protein|nr:hypothetical protein [Oscillospiraceae bacterium]